jgi:hypothetical protein
MGKARGKSPKDRSGDGRKQTVGFWGPSASPPPAVQVRNSPSAWSRCVEFLRKIVGWGRRKR